MPTPSVTLPTPESTGPIAATTMPIFTIISFWLSLRLSNHSTAASIFSTSFVIYGIKILPIEIAALSKASFKRLIFPLKFSSFTVAISSAAPSAPSIEAFNSSNLSEEVPSKALTDARSVLLKMPVTIASFDSWLIPFMFEAKSCMISDTSLKFPSES